MAMVGVAPGSLTAQVLWLRLRVGGRLVHVNWVNSRSGFRYDDSTINIIIIIITMKYGE